MLGVDSKLKEILPLDSSADDFDNIGAALHTSSFLMDRYLEAADTALNQAIANRPRPVTVKKHYSLKESHQVKSAQERVFASSTTTAWHSSARPPGRRSG